MNISRRDRISLSLSQNRLVISIELFIVVIFQALDAMGFPAIFLTFPYGWASLWARRSGWRELGLRKPARWVRTIGIATIVGVLFSVVELRLIEPLLVQLGVGTEDLSQYASIRGNIPVLVVWLLIGWGIGAFMEEMVFRGYLLNRFVDLIGGNRVGWVVGLLASSVLFGVGHAYLGFAGIVQTTLEGCAWALLYLAVRRNLWLPIIAHGITNTIAFVLMYLGLYG